MKAKRILALLLVAALAAAPLSAIAETAQPAPVRGDINGDGKINAADAVQILLHAVGKLDLDDDQQAAADIGGGGVSADDATRILLHVVGKKIFATSVNVFGDYTVEQMPIEWVLPESLEDIYTTFSAESDDAFAQANASQYALVKVTVTGEGVNVYKEDERILASHTEVPIRIDKICFAGEAMELTVGKELIVQDLYYIDPTTDTLVSYLATTPLVPGYEFYVILFRLRETGEYQSSYSYPVMSYETFSGFEQIPGLRNNAVREEILEAFENDRTIAD